MSTPTPADASLSSSYTLLPETTTPLRSSVRLFRTHLLNRLFTVESHVEAVKAKVDDVEQTANAKLAEAEAYVASRESLFPGVLVMGAACLGGLYVGRGRSFTLQAITGLAAANAVGVFFYPETIDAHVVSPLRNWLASDATLVDEAKSLVQKTQSAVGMGNSDDE